MLYTDKSPLEEENAFSHLVSVKSKKGHVNIPLKVKQKPRETLMHNSLDYIESEAMELGIIGIGDNNRENSDREGFDTGAQDVNLEEEVKEVMATEKMKPALNDAWYN